MSLTRRLILAFALVAGFNPAFAQAPPPVPALPDSERRTSYSISGTTCACAVGFQLYGDSTDVANWLEVFVNGALIPQAGNWTLSSPTGSLATIPRPITDAVLTFTAAQTGTVQIVGARRPRRTSQFSESRGVAARDLNQVITDLVAQNRETWDKINDVTGRGVHARPGETLALLPVLASRANMGACFDSGGNLTSCVAAASGTFAAGANIQFTGTNPTTISGTGYVAGNGIALTGVNPVTITNNIAAGSGITISGPNPLTIALATATNAFNVSHTIATTDCFNIVQMGSGSTYPLTLTLPSTSGFTGPCPINIVGQASRGIKLSGFSSLGLTSPGILWPQKTFSIAISNSGWVLTAGDGRWPFPAPGGAGTPFPTSASTTTINVGGAGSNDNNDGLATGTGAFASLQTAINSAAQYFDLMGQNLVFQIADAAYTQANSIHLFNLVGELIVGGHTEVIIRGNVGTLGNVTMAATGAGQHTFAMVGLYPPWRIEGIKFQSTSGACVSADGQSFLYLGTNDYNACGLGQVNASYNSFVEMFPPYTISSGSPFHITSGGQSKVLLGGGTITLTGTPAFSTAFAVVNNLSYLESSNATNIFSGPATGTRLVCGANSIIQTFGGAVTYFPGNANGTPATGCLYQ